MAGLLKFSIRLSGRGPMSTAALLDSKKEATFKTGSVAGLHTSQQLNSDSMRWKIPERLADIPDAENPLYFNMVEYYFHRACVVAEERLMGVH